MENYKTNLNIRCKECKTDFKISVFIEDHVNFVKGYPAHIVFNYLSKSDRKLITDCICKECNNKILYPKPLISFNTQKSHNVYYRK